VKFLTESIEELTKKVQELVKKERYEEAVDL